MEYFADFLTIAITNKFKFSFSINILFLHSDIISFAISNYNYVF